MTRKKWNKHKEKHKRKKNSCTVQKRCTEHQDVAQKDKEAFAMKEDEIMSPPNHIPGEEKRQRGLPNHITWEGKLQRGTWKWTSRWLNTEEMMASISTGTRMKWILRARVRQLLDAGDQSKPLNALTLNQTASTEHKCDSRRPTKFEASNLQLQSVSLTLVRMCSSKIWARLRCACSQFCKVWKGGAVGWRQDAISMHNRHTVS